MKIALITGEYLPYIRGGCGVSTTLLVQQLKKRGVSVDVYVFDKKLSPTLSNKGSVRYYNVINEKLWPLINLQATLTLQNKLGKYDLIHVYSTVRMATLGFLKRLNLKVPVVATLNGEEAACIYYQRWMVVNCRKCDAPDAVYCAFKRARKTRTWFIPGPILATYFVIQRSFSRRLDRYFALSNTIKDMYVSTGFPRDKIIVIPNMYDPFYLRRIEQSRLQKSNDKIVVLYAGRLSKEKGIEDLIRAFSMVNSNEAQLWIVGRGPNEKKLKDIADKEAKNKQIKFLGFISQSELVAVYKRADIFVHPGKWPEPFGRTILEAMLFKLPIIVSDSGAPPEILGDSGVIYRTGNIFKLAESLERLIADEKRRSDLGARAYNKAMKDYSPDVVTRRIIEEYEQLIKS